MSVATCETVGSALISTGKWNVICAVAFVLNPPAAVPAQHQSLPAAADEPVALPAGAGAAAGASGADANPADSGADADPSDADAGAGTDADTDADRCRQMQT